MTYHLILPPSLAPFQEPKQSKNFQVIDENPKGLAEAALVASVLSRAICDFFSEDKWEKKQANQFFNSQESGHFSNRFSFLDCCLHLDLDPKRIKKALEDPEIKNKLFFKRRGG